MDRIGFIGLGLMGKPMALNLLKKGFSLTVHSRSQGPVDALVAAGPVGTEDAAENTRSVFSLLKSDPGRIGLASVQGEVTKLGWIRDLDLPETLWVRLF